MTCSKRWKLALAEAAATDELDRRRFERFVRRTKPDYQCNWHHRLLIDALQRAADGEVDRLIVSMPPQHGKSELVCRRWPAWLLGRDPRRKIIACTHTASLAESHSRDIQRIIASETYRRLFPDVRLPGPRGDVRLKRTDDYWELAQGGYFRAAGVGGAITGMRFDIGIVDDPIKSFEEAESPAMRERTWRWFTHDFLTRRSRDARIVVVMTRWHRDDLAGRLLRTEPGRWTLIELPALADAAPRHQGDPRREGEALWPEFLPREELEHSRRNDPRAFAALYQQRPSEAGGVEWPESYFGETIWLDADRWPPRCDRWIMAIDPSKGRTDAPGDYAAIVVVGHAADRGLLYVDADIEVRTPEETIRRALALFDHYHPQWIVVESNQYHGLFERDFQREAVRRLGIRVPIWPITNTEPKLLRVRRLTPYLANRELLFASGSPGCGLLVDQLRDFPVGDHDDGPDALEMAVRVLVQSSSAAPRRAAIRLPGDSYVPLV